jgi:hypothetical protein
MFTIHKYTLNVGMSVVPLPLSSFILTAQEQNGSIVMWVRVPSGIKSQAMVNRRFYTAMTGEQIKDTTEDSYGYIATIQMKWSDGMVYHVFEVARMDKQ